MCSIYYTESEDTFHLLYRCIKVLKLFGYYGSNGTRFYQDLADVTPNETALTEKTISTEGKIRSLRKIHAHTSKTLDHTKKVTTPNSNHRYQIISFRPI